MKSSPAIALGHGWLTLDETMRKLGKSVSTVERLVASKTLGSKLEPVPGRKPMRLYSAEDVAKLAAAPKLNAHALVPAKAAGQLAVSRQTLTDAVMEWRNGIRVTEKLWLNLEEAQALSGLPRSVLVDWCREGRITAFKSGGWRIRRVSLEEFAGFSAQESERKGRGYPKSRASAFPQASAPAGFY